MMNNQDNNTIKHPEFTAKKGWIELEIPDSYGKGRAFITGDRNNDRLRVRYFVNDRDNSFIARVWFGPSTEGPAGFVHGGSIAAVLDEAMGIAAWIRGYTVVAAKITVHYRKMLPLGSVITVEAKVTSVNGKKVTTKGKIYDETDTLFTESEGLFINIPHERFGEMIKYWDTFHQSYHSKNE